MSGPIRLCAAAALAAGVAGCSFTSSSNSRASLSAATPPTATVAFESIDGPPADVFQKLVASLNDEAGARQIAVVSRSSPATYRIRGYVTALVERDKTTFAWVWDVYDTGKRRALRISGEEPAGPGRRRDAWTAADEQVLRRMAGNGMEQIAGFLKTPATAPEPVAEPSLVTLVMGRDDSPEAAGIFRMFRPQPTPADTPAPANAASAAAPPEAPKVARTRSAAAAAAATDGRAPRQ